MNGNQEPGSQPYELEQPAAAAPLPPVVAESGPTQAPDDARCRGCGYELRGLRSDRNCPECGMPIQRSIAGNLLIFSSPEYLHSLHKGITLALIARLVQCAVSLLIFPAIFVVASGSLGSMTQQDIETAARMISLPLVCLTFIGWWMFSAPDPAISVDDKGDKPRRILRMALCIVVAYALSDVALAGVGAMTQVMWAQPAIFGLALVAMIVQIVQFFATLLYIRWIAPRIPDPAMTSTCSTYLWMLPVLNTVGWCILVGPIIGLVLYLILLNNVRIKLGQIRRQQQLMFASA